MAASDPGGSGRRRVGAIIGVALLAAGLAGAWLIHHKYVAPSSESDDRADQRDPKAQAPTLPEEMDPMVNLIDGELLSSAVDPVDLPPPQGAELIAADTSTIDLQRIDRAKYVSDATIDEIRSHYERLMTDRGFSQAGRTQRPDGSITIVYVSGESKTILGLRKPRPDNTMESFVVMSYRRIDRTE